MRCRAWAVASSMPLRGASQSKLVELRPVVPKPSLQPLGMFAGAVAGSDVDSVISPQVKKAVDGPGFCSVLVSETLSS